MADAGIRMIGKGTSSRARLFMSSDTVRVRLIQAVGLTAFLVVWQVAGSAATYLYSTPVRVISDLGALTFSGNLASRTLDSLWTLTIGLALSLVIGVTIGMLMGRFRLFAVIVEPYLAALYSVPRIAFIPLLVIWFGIDREFVIVTVVFAATVVIVFATAAGVRDAGQAYVEVARAFRISGWHMFMKILLPGSVPFIATGMRLAVQRGLVAVIIAEYIVGLPGLGKLLRDARVTQATDRLFATAIATMVLGILLILLTSSVERRLSRWRPQAF
jgi:ABC-type nitrate/sulfonate/bicarbonate transport system permease component